MNCTQKANSEKPRANRELKKPLFLGVWEKIYSFAGGLCARNFAWRTMLDLQPGAEFEANFAMYDRGICGF
jgi:hypothetical protein